MSNVKLLSLSAKPGLSRFVSTVGAATAWTGWKRLSHDSF